MSGGSHESADGADATEEQEGGVVMVDPVDDNTAHTLLRIETGNPQADEILGGGFMANSINIVMGEPGTGKTIFAEQLAFHNADAERPVLYLTTLSEPLSKVLTYLQQFHFYDASQVGSAVVYDDIGHELVNSDIDALVSRVREAIRTIAPRVIIIDSFRAVHDLAPSTSAMRRMIHDLAGLVSAYEASTFLVGEYTPDHVSRYPEFAVADGIVEMIRRKRDTRDERFFRVLKLRGSDYWEGTHDFRITRDGITVYPRLVMPGDLEAADPSPSRVQTGIAGLDPVLNGGLWKGSTTLVAGPSGAGKTSLALHFALEALEGDESSLYVNFQENPTQMARVMQGFGLDPEEAQAQGLHLLYASPVELQVGSVMVDIFKMVQDRGISRVAVDAVSDLAKTASQSNRLYDYLYTLVQLFARNDITALLTYEASGRGITGESRLDARFSYMSDNTFVLNLDGDARPQRTLRVIKTRGSPHDPDARELAISSDGVRVK